ncbi:MAG: elongation factor P [Deltaproteobacteria bacterium]|nr:elongation factor P [Deltaproteobacteria bacterium]
MVQATKLRPGSVIIFEGDLCRVMSAHHHTPGNLRAMMQVKMRSLKSGTQFEHRFRSTDDVEAAYLETHQMEYLYDDGERYHFMNSETFEQMDLDHDFMGDAINYVLPNTKVSLTFYDGKPVGLDLPENVDLKVIEAEPSVKKQTASASYKKCVVETGLAVMVPSFVEVDDVIRINTETGEYKERAGK